LIIICNFFVFFLFYTFKKKFDLLSMGCFQSHDRGRGFGGLSRLTQAIFFVILAFNI